MTEDPHQFNRTAWDHAVEQQNEWTLPVSPSEIEAARMGRWEIRLTPVKPVPRPWFEGKRRAPPLLKNEVTGELPEEGLESERVEELKFAGQRILCLAGSGGQQAPILAAAGAEVTVFDQSDKQLGQDRLVAEREGLSLRLVQGDMTLLSQLDDEEFDLIVNPCSTCFVAELLPVWRECFRVLKPGGSLMTGYCAPHIYCFDYLQREQGHLEVKYSLPHRDLDYPELVKQLKAENEPLEFSHSYETQIGDLLRSGFMLLDFFEDVWKEADPLNDFMPSFAAMLAQK